MHYLNNNNLERYYHMYADSHILFVKSLRNAGRQC